LHAEGLRDNVIVAYKRYRITELLVYNHARHSVPMEWPIDFGPHGQDFKKGVARFLEKRALLTGR